jgi:hypothetical protein
MGQQQLLTMRNIPTKKPSAATDAEKSSERQLEIEHRLSQARLLLHPTLVSACRLRQRACFERLLRQFNYYSATGWPRANSQFGARLGAAQS